MQLHNCYQRPAALRAAGLQTIASWSVVFILWQHNLKILITTNSKTQKPSKFWSKLLMWPFFEILIHSGPFLRFLWDHRPQPIFPFAKTVGPFFLEIFSFFALLWSWNFRKSFAYYFSKGLWFEKKNCERCPYPLENFVCNETQIHVPIKTSSGTSARQGLGRRNCPNRLQ